MKEQKKISFASRIGAAFGELKFLVLPIAASFAGALAMVTAVNAFDGLDAPRGRVSRRERIAAIDADIDASMFQIDSIRANTPRVARDSMMRNRDYAFAVENADLMEPLARIQDSLLDAAVNIAQRRSIINLVPRDECVFRNYASIPAISQIGHRYKFNRDFIARFNMCNAAAPSYERGVRNYFDSLANAQIKMRLDSVNYKLREKQKLLSR